MKDRQTHGGKGDLARSVNKAKFDENFDKIFGKKDTRVTSSARKLDWREAETTIGTAKEVG